MQLELTNQLLCSAINVDRRTRYYGDANILDISALRMIYELIDCQPNLEHEKLLKLQELSQCLIIRNKDICNLRGDSVFLENNNLTTRVLVNLNNPPQVDDNSVLFNNGDESFNFTNEQFKLNFTDVDGDLPETVKIVTLPINGTLSFNGINIPIGFLFNIEEASSLLYTRAPSLYTDTFVFQTSDNNINKLFSNMAQFTVTVQGQVNQPPTEVGDGSANTAFNTPIVFTRAQFTTSTTPPYNDPEGDAAATLRITSLPADGEIQLSGVPILVNAEIDFAQIDLRNLRYVPDGTITTTHMPAFTFEIADAGSGQFVG